MQLSEHASVIRSKNAGPFSITIDIFFVDAAAYELARASTLMTVPGIARAYGVDDSNVKGVWWDDRIRGAKVSLLRWSSSSDPFCSDLFGAHLHTPLASSELV
jgi:Domain of unknown function (DUF4387)